MTYDEAMKELNNAVYAAIRASGNEDEVVVEALKLLAHDIDSLIDHGATWADSMLEIRALHNLVRFAGAGFSK